MANKINDKQNIYAGLNRQKSGKKRESHLEEIRDLELLTTS